MKVAEFETLVENAAETGHSAWTDAAVESGLMREVDTHDPRLAYRGRTLLTAHTEIETDTWQSGLNNNVLVLGARAAAKPATTSNPTCCRHRAPTLCSTAKAACIAKSGPTWPRRDT